MSSRADAPTRRGITLVLLLALTGVACDDDVSGPLRFEAQEPFAFAIAVTTQEVWSLTNLNGQIEVLGVPGGDSIRVEGTKRVMSNDQDDADQRLADIEVTSAAGADSITIRSVHPPSGDGRTYVVDYQLSVPAELLGFTANGNGDITLESLRADVEIQLGNGNALVEDLVGGAVIEVGNGDVECQATLPAAGGAIAIGVGNGNIDLAVPVTTSAQVSATVGNGTISVSGLTLVDRTETETTLAGRLGAGTSSITLAVANGDIVINGF